MRVGDFMTRRVMTVAPDASIVEAAKLMLEHKISGLPVIDAAHHVVGIVSEHDLLRRLSLLLFSSSQPIFARQPCAEAFSIC